MKKILFALTTGAMAASLSSCYIRISDAARKELRETKTVEVINKGLDSIRIDCEPFYKVVTTTSLDIKIIPTDGEPRAIVVGSTNLRDSVRVVNNDGVLVIDYKCSTFNQKDERVIVYATKWLNAAATRGSGDLSIGFDDKGAMIDGLCSFTDLTVVTDGSGDVILGNICVNGSFNYSSLGAGDLFCTFLKAKDATVSTKGSGDTAIDGCDIENLSLSTYGSGDMEIAGEATSAVLKTYGSGDIDVTGLVLGNGAISKDSKGSGKIKGL